MLKPNLLVFFQLNEEFHSFKEGGVLQIWARHPPVLSIITLVSVSW